VLPVPHDTANDASDDGGERGRTGLMDILTGELAGVNGLDEMLTLERPGQVHPSETVYEYTVFNAMVLSEQSKDFD
jgi:hypothetical protein